MLGQPSTASRMPSPKCPSCAIPSLMPPTCIITDASNVAVGAVLQQCINDMWSPIAYFSKKLRPAETHYSTFDRELLAIYLSIKHFRHFVEGQTFHVVTFHKPLMFALSSASRNHSPRQVWHLDFIAQFTSDIKYIPGSTNAAANALSRIEIEAIHMHPIPSHIDFQAMPDTQCQEAIPETVSPLLTLRPVPIHNSEKPHCYVIPPGTGTPRPLVPQQYRRQVFEFLHSLSHPGIRATQKLITTRYVWPGINKDARD